MRSNLHLRLVSIFSDIFQMEIDPNIEDISADEIGEWDSINKLRLILELEQAFGVSLADDEAMDLRSLGQAKQLLAKRGL